MSTNHRVWNIYSHHILKTNCPKGSTTCNTISHKRAYYWTAACLLPRTATMVNPGSFLLFVFSSVFAFAFVVYARLWLLLPALLFFCFRAGLGVFSCLIFVAFQFFIGFLICSRFARFRLFSPTLTSRLLGVVFIDCCSYCYCSIVIVIVIVIFIVIAIALILACLSLLSIM